MRNISNKSDVTDSLAAAKWNAQNNERQNLVTSADLTLDNEAGPDTNLNMLSEAVSGYANAANVYNDSGAPGIYVLSLATSMKPPHKYHDNMQVIFKVANTNNGPTPSVNVVGLGAKSITYPGGTALGGGDLIEGEYVRLVYDLAGNRFILIPAETRPVRDSARGLVVKRITAATIDIDADENVVADAALVNARRVTGANVTVDITASGVNGLDTGSEAASTNYFVFLIFNTANDAINGLISASKTSPTLPTNHTQFALVGEFFNDSGSDITYVNQIDGQFLKDGVVSGKDPAGATIIGSFTNLVDLDLGTVTEGDVFLMEGIVAATKGGSTGTTGIAIAKKSGTATVVSHFDGAGGRVQNGVGANVDWIFETTTEFTVTVSGTLVMELEAVSLTSNSALSTGDAQARVRFIKKA